MTDVVDWPAKIAAANTLFASMTPQERRVAIAQDVIEQLRCGRYMAEPSVYIIFDDINPKINVETDLLQVIESANVCYICARGGVFASAVRLFDNMKCDKLLARSGAVRSRLFDTDINAKELEFFSEDQILQIEVAFEYERVQSKGMWYLRPALHLDINHYLSALTFGKNHPDPTDRMIAIMENIVKNNGVFTP